MLKIDYHLFGIKKIITPIVTLLENDSVFWIGFDGVNIVAITNSYEILLEFPGNLGSGPIELNNDWVIIGDGGWYDYSFGVEGYTKEEFALGTFNKFTWPDKIYAHWPGQDHDETERYCKKLEGWLSAYSRKNIIMVTHFVPFSKFVICKDDPNWDFFNAMMGSSRFGDLAVKYGVKKYIFGHIHTRYHEQYKGMEIICNPLGYYPHEWDCGSAEEEIFSRVKVVEIQEGNSASQFKKGML